MYNDCFVKTAVGSIQKCLTHVVFVDTENKTVFFLALQFWDVRLFVRCVLLSHRHRHHHPHDDYNEYTHKLFPLRATTGAARFAQRGDFHLLGVVVV